MAGARKQSGRRGGTTTSRTSKDKKKAGSQKKPAGAAEQAGRGVGDATLVIDKGKLEANEAFRGALVVRRLDTLTDPRFQSDAPFEGHGDEGRVAARRRGDQPDSGPTTGGGDVGGPATGVDAVDDYDSYEGAGGGAGTLPYAAHDLALPGSLCAAVFEARAPYPAALGLGALARAAEDLAAEVLGAVAEREHRH